jgi:hypothetical protein
MTLSTSSSDASLPPPDPEFGAQVASNWSEIEEHPEWFVRVVCNPFLAFGAVILWLAIILDAAMRGWARELTVPLAIVSAGLLVLSLPRLCRYHCLDCGHSAPLGEWRRHLCPSAAGRRLANQPRRWRGPLPIQQFWIAFVLAWLVILWRCALG